MESLQDILIVQEFTMICVQNSANSWCYLHQEAANTRHVRVFNEDRIKFSEPPRDLSDFILIELADNLPGKVHPETAFSAVQVVEDLAFTVGTGSAQASH
ncbi:hypothetical protein ACWC5F_07645 [Streptomyces sp. NPDC001272]